MRAPGLAARIVSRPATLSAAASGAAALWLAAASAQVPSLPGPYGPAPSAEATRPVADGLQRSRNATLGASVSVKETYTTNVGLQPAATRRSDFITQIVPALQIAQQGARSSLVGSIAAPIVLYANTGSANNRVSPQVNLIGNLNLVERLLYLDGAVQVTQSYFSPFGPTSSAIENHPRNAYTSYSYRLSPYLKGTAPGNITYELRDDNVWTTLSRAPVAVDSSYTNQVSANLTQNVAPLGWAADYRRSEVKFSSQPSQVTELERGQLLYRPDPQLELAVGAGYERARYPAASYQNVTYGAGARWRPTERTTLDGAWAHRYFGSSYRVSFEERTPLTVWSVTASRDATSYPQVLAELRSGGIVASLLNTMFASRFPDPAQRERFVQQFIQDRGLPQVLTGPLTLYTRRAYLEERASATLGLIGARNGIFLTAFRLRTQPIGGLDPSVDALLQLLNDNTQLGGGVVWTHALTPLVSLVTSVDYRRATANAPLRGTSRQGAVNSALSFPLSANTSVHGGARYQRLRSDLGDSFDEAAVFIGFSHSFR